MKAKYQLVIQTVASSIGDYDEMIALEKNIERQLGDAGIVDGHDMGAGEANIFLEVADPRVALSRIINALSAALPGVKIAYRETGSNDYTPLFPPGLSDFRVR